MADISSGNMEQHFSKYISQIEAVEENETLLRQLSVYSSADWDEKKKTENEMRLLINSIFGQNQEVDTVEISSADGAKFYYPSPVTQKESPLLARTKASEGPLWSFIPKEIGTDRENYIVISKTMEPYGNIVLALKKDYAETLCQNAGAGKQWKTAIFDGSGVLVAGENAFDRDVRGEGEHHFHGPGKDVHLRPCDHSHAVEDRKRSALFLSAGWCLSADCCSGGFAGSRTSGGILSFEDHDSQYHGTSRKADESYGA